MEKQNEIPPVSVQATVETRPTVGVADESPLPYGMAQQTNW